MKIAYIITASSLTAVVDSKPYTLGSTHPNYKLAVAALQSSNVDKSRLLGLLSVSTAVKAYSDGNVSVQDGVVTYKGKPMHNYCTQKILEFMQNGLDYKRLLRFFDNLMDNPSARAVNELYSFLEHKAMPITDDGCFLAYKGVREDYYSITAGSKDAVLQGTVNADGRIYNAPGEVIEVTRNYVDDNANRGCSSGLHAGSHAYASDFGRGGRLLIVKINPKDVVSVPHDCSCQKLRTAKYEVVDEISHDTVLPAEFSDEVPPSAVSGGDNEQPAKPDYAAMLRQKAISQKRDSNGRFVK